MVSTARVGAKLLATLITGAVGAAAIAGGVWPVVAMVAAYWLYLWVLDGSWIIF